MRVIGIDVGGTSAKACCLQNGEVLWEKRSDSYSRPDLADLTRTLENLVGGCRGSAVGLCVPGAFDSMTGMVAASANMPCLVGVNLKEWIQVIAGAEHARIMIDTDVYATAVSIWHERGKVAGRLCVIAIGTGVGMCVLTNGERLAINGLSSGHLGQIDVTLDDEPSVIGPDGGRGGLEGYVGLGALKTRFGNAIDEGIAGMNRKSPPLRALARAIRIVHAIYRPDSIVIAGGVGIMFKAVAGTLSDLVNEGKTSLAREHCTIGFADNVFHAARGIAAIAART